jgi:hypothetical protein
MTAQRADILILNGKKRALLATPLDVVLAATNNSKRFTPQSTNLWRGYVATWSIQKNHLYLLSVQGWISHNPEPQEAMGLLFPNQKGPVFAHWVSRALRVADGPLFDYVHQGFGRRFKHELIFEMWNGEIIEQKRVTYDS